MPKILVPVDGSAESVRAARLAGTRKEAEIFLLNVQSPLPQSVSTFVSATTVQDYHKEEGDKALAPAEAALREAGVSFHRHLEVGTAAETITSFADKHHIDEIVMGVRGLGSVLNLLLGSVTTKVLSLTSKPVTLVK